MLAAGARSERLLRWQFLNRRGFCNIRCVLYGALQHFRAHPPNALEHCSVADQAEASTLVVSQSRGKHLANQKIALD